jgi:hypothetical protein
MIFFVFLLLLALETEKNALRANSALGDNGIEGLCVCDTLEDKTNNGKWQNGNSTTSSRTKLWDRSAFHQQLSSTLGTRLNNVTTPRAFVFQHTKRSTARDL